MTNPVCQIVGFGPGCTSFLIAADRQGILPELLGRGLLIHEREGSAEALLPIGVNYDIPSNSDAADFLDGIAPDGLFGPLLDGPAARMIRMAGGRAISLQLVALLVEETRRLALEAIRRHPNSRVAYGSPVTRIGRTAGGWRLHDAQGRGVESPLAVLAAGSAPHLPDGLRRAAAGAGVPLVHSDAVLRPCDVTALLPAGARSIAVVGASHSAFSVLHKLLELYAGGDLRLTLLHTQPIRRMHRGAALARAAGERFDPATDQCPASGRIFRFQGLYTRSRLLYEQILAGQHPAIALRACDDEAAVADALRGADAVIAATGYRPNLPPLTDVRDRPLAAGRNGSAVQVGRDGQLRAADGGTLPGLLGIGLGFGRDGSGIGEPSYRGAPVGINIFQGPDGDALCARALSALQHAAGACLEKEYL
ncbi:hypothetical protein J2847_004968 [Azospirillum agricola]|uniref:hypothetical protein n=1 Tax=Azospirillum agricola TaxID=1720247 RepID=UPI001AE51998|nr:hypothetical protein [Azospirillum agricola]MBP2231649.1 hypothetical protein [Azospirillum agricola]